MHGAGRHCSWPTRRPGVERAGATTPIAPRQRTRVAGHVRSIRVQPRTGTSNLECVPSDGTGGLLLVFQGRPKIAGIEPRPAWSPRGWWAPGDAGPPCSPPLELVQGAQSDPSGP